MDILGKLRGLERKLLPAWTKLEQAFYPKASTIARAALATLGHDPNRVGDLALEDNFKGPY